AAPLVRPEVTRRVVRSPPRADASGPRWHGGSSDRPAAGRDDAGRGASPPGVVGPTVRSGQSRVSLRYVTRCGRAASAPRRSTLFSSYDAKLPSNQYQFAGFSSVPSYARMWVATRSRNHRSWDTTTAQPGYSSSAFSSEPRVSTSRTFVGSSDSKRLPRCFSVGARLVRWLIAPG